MSVKVYEVITDRILESLKQGVVPWRMPWNKVGGTPKNLQSGKAYRGVNVFLLSAMRYAAPWFVTYKQCAARGGQVRKGEKGCPVIFWKVGDSDKVDPKTGKKGKYFILRYYTVFNVEQCDNLSYPKPEVRDVRTFEPIERCEEIVRAYKTLPGIDHGGDRACYSPSFDRISMPNKEQFEGEEEYYSTLFHELVHSTGHESRLSRDGIMNPIRFASHEYSFEELVAECGAAFLCGHAGILDHTIDNSAAYIANWSAKLRSEPKWIVEAASKAGKASDYIMGDLLKEEEDEDTEEPGAAERAA
jgi:antirestriction protein ArdC